MFSANMPSTKSAAVKSAPRKNILVKWARGNINLVKLTPRY